MKIKYAEFETAYDYLSENDKHISSNVLKRKIQQKEIIIISDNAQILGWLRFGYFWDLIPIMNMISLEDEYRGKGLGSQLVSYWEAEMSKQGYKSVMTTTLSDEQAQHFYRKLGYKDVGALLLPDEALEIIFIKTLR
jgi:ribosomal protein S18 acetylase RimI-like enzyme